MTAYELSERKIKMLELISYLKREAEGNNTETVLLTNDEVYQIVNMLEQCIEVTDEELKKR